MFLQKRAIDSALTSILNTKKLSYGVVFFLEGFLCANVFMHGQSINNRLLRSWGS
jgi:hypothetical protein